MMVDGTATVVIALHQAYHGEESSISICGRQRQPERIRRFITIDQADNGQWDWPDIIHRIAVSLIPDHEPFHEIPQTMVGRR